VPSLAGRVAAMLALSGLRCGAVLLAFMTVLSGCGGTDGDRDGGAADGQRQGGPDSAEAPAGEQSEGRGKPCPDVAVPGHEAVNVRTRGVPCSQAEQVAGDALGKGRQTYEASGFTCRPSEAGDGDTDYVCARGEARVSFRYGAA